MRKLFPLLLFLAALLAVPAHAQPMRVLWWDISLDERGNSPSNRQRMARFVDGYQNGTLFYHYHHQEQQGTGKYNHPSTRGK